jgi:hypothetical protein
VGRISLHRRRADNDTWQTTHAPMALAETAVAATVSKVVASGRRWRNCMATTETTPSATSIQSSAPAAPHSSRATSSQSPPPATAKKVLRQFSGVPLRGRPELPLGRPTGGA